MSAPNASRYCAGRPAAFSPALPETRLYTKSDTLYALDIVRNHIAKSRQLTVVEGYTDVILCHQHGVSDVVACCGTALNERHIRLLKRFADTVYLVLDGDAAGQSRTNDILELFVAAQMDLRILTLPVGLVASRSPNLKYSVPVASTIFCTGVNVGWSIPHS